MRIRIEIEQGDRTFFWSENSGVTDALRRKPGREVERRVLARIEPVVRELAQVLLQHGQADTVVHMTERLAGSRDPVLLTARASALVQVGRGPEAALAVRRAWTLARKLGKVQPELHRLYAQLRGPLLPTPVRH
jgi:hypothetical protein